MSKFITRQLNTLRSLSKGLNTQLQLALRRVTKIPVKTKKHFYLAITGTMGAGKTTVAKLLAKKLKFHLIEENFGENAFLARFYRDMKRWAFHSQTFFLMEKIAQTLSTHNLLTNKNIIQDVPIYQDVFSYAKAQHIMANMDDAEWRLYQKIYRSFEPNLPRPNYLIYIKTSLESVKARIGSRDRSFERRIPDGYLELLEMLNEAWMKKEANGIKVITVETDNLNLIKSSRDREVFIKKIIQSLKL